MRSAVPGWLTPLALTYISLSLLSLTVIAVDIYLLRRRPRSVAADRTAGEAGCTAVAVLPGGGASAVAHLVAVPFVVAAGWTIAGLAMWPMIRVIAALATVMVAVHQLVVSRDPRPGRARRVLVGAGLAAAFVTVAAFDVGMVGWMLLLHFNDLMPPVTGGTFWFLMQIGVIVGLLTGYPAVSWLLRRSQSVAPA